MTSSKNLKNRLRLELAEARDLAELRIVFDDGSKASEYVVAIGPGDMFRVRHADGEWDHFRPAEVGVEFARFLGAYWHRRNEGSAEAKWLANRFELADIASDSFSAEMQVLTVKVAGNEDGGMTIAFETGLRSPLPRRLPRRFDRTKSFPLARIQWVTKDVNSTEWWEKPYHPRLVEGEKKEEARASQMTCEPPVQAIAAFSAPPESSTIGPLKGGFGWFEGIVGMIAADLAKEFLGSDHSVARVQAAWRMTCAPVAEIYKEVYPLGGPDRGQFDEAAVAGTRPWTKEARVAFNKSSILDTIRAELKEAVGTQIEVNKITAECSVEDHGA